MTHDFTQEAEAFLAAHPDIQYITLLLTDLNGVPRGKRIRRHELAAICRHGRPLPSSILALDMLGNDCDGTGLVWDVADQDCPAFPVPGSLKRCPWTPDTAQLLLSLRADGDLPLASGADPRNVLTRVVDRLQADGMTPVVACELEFYLLDKAAWLAGEVRPATSSAGFPLDRTNVYSVEDLDGLTPFLNDLYAACAAQGIPAETAISEYAPGQMEITLAHRADTLKAIDEAIQFKRIIKAVSDQHGMIATFMAKPFAEQSGSGMHLHASVEDAKGNNMFDTEGVQEGSRLHHAIGGLATTMAEAMLIFAPHANSYRRFRAASYAPVGTHWGINNRTVSLRVPNAHHSLHVEHRVSGADANPYLVAAAVLAGMHKGIEDRLDPGAPIEGNGYLLPSAPLPGHWYAAIEGFERSGFIADYLGDAFQKVFGAIKRAECDRYFGEVTAQDHSWYLRSA